MKAVRFQGGKVAVVEKPLPPSGHDETLIRTAMAGICSTDRELLAGYHDFAGVPGHEFVGTVVRAPAKPEWIGRRVVQFFDYVKVASLGRCQAWNGVRGLESSVSSNTAQRLNHTSASGSGIDPRQRPSGREASPRATGLDGSAPS